VTRAVKIGHHVDRLRAAMVSGLAPRTADPRMPFPLRYRLPPREWWRLHEDVAELARRAGTVGPLSLESVPEHHFMFMGVPVVIAPLDEGEWRIDVQANAA
jgi:hypothetical protein